MTWQAVHKTSLINWSSKIVFMKIIEFESGIYGQDCTSNQRTIVILQKKSDSNGASSDGR